MKNPWLVRFLTLILMAAISACGGGGTPVPATVPPSATPTPHSTALPTVGTTVPLGSSERPFQVVVMLPEDSTATGTSLASFLNERTGLTFKVEVISSTDPNRPNALEALCGGTPTFGWVDGWTLLAAQAQGCAEPVLRLRRNTEDGDSTGIASDIIVRSVNKTTSLAGLKDRIFCRLNSQDVASWILPVIMLRGAGIGPQNLSSVRDNDDYGTMLQALADGVCIAAAIPAGTLAQYKVTDKGGQTDITKILNQVATTPEVPYGGLVIASTVPRDLAEQVTKLFVDHPDELKGLVAADQFVNASPADFAEIEKFILAGGVDLRTLGQ
jgi:ABC-type phosphate/phosphonate transport system substrate-binding protein